MSKDEAFAVMLDALRSVVNDIDVLRFPLPSIDKVHRGIRVAIEATSTEELRGSQGSDGISVDPVDQFSVHQVIDLVRQRQGGVPLTREESYVMDVLDVAFEEWSTKVKEEYGL